ncbi:MAG: ankyrin repeat protein, partial [Flavobacteriales bacterium]
MFMEAQSQSRRSRKNQTPPPPQVVIQNDVLGHGFDIRYADPMSWGASSKGRALITGIPSTSTIQSTSPATYHFITNPYEFEHEILRSDSLQRPFLSINSAAYFKPLKQDGSDKLLFVYSKKKMTTSKASLQNGSLKKLDSALISDFSRLGRDITPEGFVHRYGTHFASAVTYGGLFLRRNLYFVDDYIYSPYTKEEFKQNLIEDMNAFYSREEDTDTHINTKIGDDFTVGGNTSADWHTQWEKTVQNRSHPIDVTLQRYSDLLKTVSIPGLEEKAVKVKILDSIISLYEGRVKDSLQRQLDPVFYKKYSLRFKQKLTKIVKTSMGRDTDDPNDYTGDIFFGGFSKDDAILKQLPLVEYGGIRLETLITDEEIQIDRNVIVTIKPEDLNRGYVSVWDDTKKLFKSKDRKTLRVSGSTEAKTVYKDALLRLVEKEVELETVDKDIYTVTYTLELLKDKGYIENTTTTYNYVLDTELVAAAAIGDIEKLSELFNRNGDRNSSGIIKAILVNKQSAAVLNFVLDQGVIATTEDLDIAFELEYYDAKKILILLERGAVPKNNMIFKAVAYKDANAIYALFREGAEPRNNDLAQALKIYHYPAVKALMSDEFEEFEAGKNELLLAASNNDEEMASQFIQLGAIADAYILEQATQFDNEALKNVIVPVTEASGKTLEVVAKINDTELFDYFVKKNAKIETNKAAELATDNKNTKILDLALKNGGEATEALDYAIEKDYKAGVVVSLENKAKPEAVFAYAIEHEYAQLFEDALVIYEGAPEIALQEAVKQDKIALAKTVIDLKPEDINTTNAVQIAVSNQSLSMVELLIENDADPNEGIQEASSRENVSITAFLIKSGAETLKPEYIQEAVKKENLELSKLLVE